MKAWGLSTEQARTLMGGLPTSTYERRLLDPEQAQLTPDELLRASYILGIYCALHALYSGELPNAWMTIPNSNPLFGGKTPYEYAARHGARGLADIRTLLDGRCQGF